MALLGSFLDVSRICRLCLGQDHPLTEIFSSPITDGNYIGPSTPSKILACVRFEVNFEDNLPDKICNRCSEQIENWIKFKDLCDNANSLLLQFAAGMHGSQLTDQILQRCSTTNNSKQLEMPESSSDFCLEDVSFLEQDPFFQKLVSKEDSLLVQDSLSVVLSVCKNIQNNLESVDEVKKEANEECEKEASRTKWRLKYSKIYARNYECGICSCIFTRFNTLLLHDRTEHKDISTKEMCFKCNQLFISKQRLDTHINLKHKEKIYECETCGLKSVSEKSLRVHRLKHSGKFQCNVCNFVASSQSSLKDHIRIHSSERTYHCEICDQAFKQRQSLHHHIKSHQSNSGIEFKCNICSGLFKNLDTFKKHKDSHNDDKLFICEFCGANYKHKSSLCVHKLNYKDKKHSCMLCDKYFSTSNLLQRHMLVHIARPFVCSICTKTFNRADTLSLHMKTHSSSKAIICKYCGRSFKLNKYLNRHLARVHDYKKSFKTNSVS